jgi:hypothetical protein
MIRTLIILIVITFASCQTNKENSGAADSLAVAATTADSVSSGGDNQVTQSEAADGYESLFNGTNTDGWRIFKNKENNSWEVVDGMLHCKPFDVADKRADIMTIDKYENFDLSFDWKISPQGNSGVMFRVTEEFNEPYFSGPEYQVIDDKGYPGELQKTQLTASNYDMHAAPDDKPVKPVGEWNNSRIVVNGNHVEHYLNGTKVLEYDINSEDWTKRKNGSKWKNEKGYGIAKSGHIDFQDHGNEVWYKNIKIKTL